MLKTNKVKNQKQKTDNDYNGVIRTMKFMIAPFCIVYEKGRLT